jgi:ectoine hydroxylase-related dioxygenase (phytanoyl-CoA dioxygenase family)
MTVAAQGAHIHGCRRPRFKLCEAVPAQVGSYDSIMTSALDRTLREELKRLREEVDSLRAQSAATEIEVHLAVREREYRRRMGFLETAIASAASGPGSDDRQFAELLSRVKAIVAEIHSQGYVVVPGLLDPEQVARTRDALEPLFATARNRFASLDPGGPRQTFHVHNVFAKTRAADEAALNPFLRAIVGSILGHDFILHAGAVVMSPDPGCSAQGLHRDDASYATLPRPRMPLVLTAAIALDDFTKQNGATHLVPGSCRWPGPRRPESGEVIQCEMAAGSVLLWDGAIFHGGGGNSTASRTRRTLTFNYTRGWLRTQFNQYLSVPRALVLSMPAELQKDLGYHPSARGLGECDNRHPLAYLRLMLSHGGDGSQAMLGPEEAQDHAEPEPVAKKRGP